MLIARGTSGSHARVIGAISGAISPADGSEQALIAMTDTDFRSVSVTMPKRRTGRPIARGGQSPPGLGAIVALASLVLVLVIVAGCFLASEPALYRRGTVMLFPKSQQARVEDALAQTGAGLHQWVEGQLISMMIVGLLIGLGVWIIGRPTPIAWWSRPSRS